MSSPEWASILRDVGLRDFFADPRVAVWRDIAERQNATFDAIGPDGRPFRLHIKRDKHRLRRGSCIDEVRGIEALMAAGVPTTPLVAAGRDADGRGFVATLDLAGHRPADVALDAGLSFDAILTPTSTLAAKLHAARLCHRDLYLNHFFVADADPADVRLIDAARVGRWFWKRWVVKDLAQFAYSTRRHGVTRPQLDAWFAAYAAGVPFDVASLRSAVDRKADWIARHDAKLRREQPTRNVSLPL